MDELIKSLPAEALVGLGAVVGLGLLARFFGLSQGMKGSPEHSASSAQVAAVIVDSTALNRGTAAIEALNITLMESNSVGRERIKSDLALASELDDIREEMRIQREINRRQ
jgi:hypothetical protein